MDGKITLFRGPYWFLSNMYPCRISIFGMDFGSVEAAYQSRKPADDAERARFATLSGPEARKLGRRLHAREDWFATNADIMLEILRAKFAQNPDLAGKLLATGDAELVETNTWHDLYWGVDAATGKGKNMLGKMLMRVRTELVDRMQQDMV